jgi:hypothetical protein
LPPSQSSPPSSADRLRSGLLASTSKSAAIIKRADHTFSGQLTLEDRRRLRAIVLKTHRFLFAADASTTHLDQVIDSIGPEVARQMVLRHVASGRIG